MKKRIYLLLFLTVLFHSLKAQVGRDWIISGQSYWKIPVAEEGIYAIPFSQLSSNGVNISDPNKLQVWHRGKEQSITIQNSNLYFYGKGNDGYLDSLLYEPMSSQNNKYYSLFNDTTYYFVTVGSIDGKRISDFTVASSPNIDYHYHNDLQVYTDQYSEGEIYAAETHLSTGDVGEGWVSPFIYQNGTNPVYSSKTFNITNLSTSFGTAEIEMVIVGRNTNNHVSQVLLGNDVNNPIATFNVPNFSGRKKIVFKQTFSSSLLTNNSPLKITLKVIGTGTKPDAVSIAHILLKYPQQLNITSSQQHLYPYNNGSDKGYVINNVTNGAFIWDVSDEYNVFNYPYSLSGSSASININNTTKDLLYSTNFKTILSIQTVDLTPYSLNGDFIIVSHPLLMSGATDYANYKSSTTGGNHSVILTDIKRLYNLYSYGEKNPIAIKRFCIDLLGVGKAKYLFLIGKGVNINYEGPTNQGSFYYRKNPNAFINNTFEILDIDYRMEDLIPTYGYPASDILYSIVDNTNLPKLATGRLSARTNADVVQYLDKIKSHEILDSNSLWRKHLLHLSGGKTASELTYFRGVMDRLKTIAENPTFGGHIGKTFSKNLNTGAVDQQLIGSIAEEVNKGVSYLSYFGHSSPYIVDLDIGRVSNPIYGYNNQNKYPMLIANGCQAAEFFIEGSIPEDWIMTPNKGAILVMGHAHIGYPYYMESYTSNFYKLNFNDSRYINKSIGEIQQKTIDTFLTLNTRIPVTIAQCEQFVLQGDPSIRMYKPSKTDYAIAGDLETGERKSYIKAYNNQSITAMSDSFAIAIPVINYGVSSTKKTQIRVRHYVSGSLFKEYKIKDYNPVYYIDTLIFNIPAKNEKLFGSNRFEIYVDVNDSIKEMNESNNIATLNYFLPLSSVSCLYPLEFSVVYNQPINFIAQSNNLLQGQRDYYIEIDTSHLYNSPSKIVKTLSSTSLIKFTQNLLTDKLPSDSIVYYWRIRFNDLPAGETPIWDESSFIYIKNSPPGWSQSEFPQIQKDQFNQINITSTGTFEFPINISRIKANTQGNASGSAALTVAASVNDNSMINLIPSPNYCPAGDGVYVLVFDDVTVLPYKKNNAPYVCGNFLAPRVHAFYGMQNAGAQNNLETFLNSVKPNEYVLIISTGSAFADLWSSSLKTVLNTDFGAQQLNNLTSKAPYLLLSKKGAGTVINEVYSTDETATISLDNSIQGKFEEGTITSTLIGPASQWSTLKKETTLTAKDTASISVIRIKQDGSTFDTLKVALNGDIDLSTLVDANQFPYLKLLYYTADTVNQTPAILNKWQVLYSPVPEGSLNPNAVGIAQYTVSKKLNGETFNLTFNFENIYDIDFTIPLKAVMTLKSDNGKIKRDTILLGPLTKGANKTFTYTVNTTGYYGKDVLQVYVNPALQPEQYYTNNVLDIPFEVLEDKTHPIVDVMFDNVHIFDGDIVSPSPLITVSINDNNPYLTYSDPSSIEVYLMRPGKSNLEQINNTNQDVIKWGEDPQRKGKFIVEYNPKNLPDGTYKLIVQGKDASGNKSGSQTFEIRFEVVNASTITNFYPYPNPFSSSTRFVFTLTGSEIPEDLKIQIITVSGKVIREIMKNELGNIHIGNNVTDFHWDGTDEFGDKLANGVYIYRVIIKNKNDKFEHRETAGDKAFKKGYGKLYILR